MRTQGEVHYIDPRVDHVGVSRLRQLDAKALKENTNDKTLVIRERDEPVAVLLSYEQYLIMQNQLRAVMETLDILTSKEEFAMLVSSMKEASGSGLQGLDDIRREFTKEQG